MAAEPQNGILRCECTFRTIQPVERNDSKEARAESHPQWAIVITTYRTFQNNRDIFFHSSGLRNTMKGTNSEPKCGHHSREQRFDPPQITLTGAPMQNNLRELWFSLTLSAWAPGHATLFESQFVDPINAGGYVNASRMQAQMAFRCATVLREFMDFSAPQNEGRRCVAVARKDRSPFCKLTTEQKALQQLWFRRGRQGLKGQILAAPFLCCGKFATTPISCTCTRRWQRALPTTARRKGAAS